VSETRQLMLHMISTFKYIDSIGLLIKVFLNHDLTINCDSHATYKTAYVMEG
jgi:hypothetical protein